MSSTTYAIGVASSSFSSSVMVSLTLRSIDLTVVSDFCSSSFRLKLSAFSYRNARINYTFHRKVEILK